MPISKTLLLVTNNSTGTSQEYEYNGAHTELNLTGLQPLTSYTVRARAQCSNVFGSMSGYSALGAPVTFTTLPLSQSSYPTSYDSDHRYFLIDNPEGAYTEPAAGTGYCDVYLTRGESAETYIYWNFGNISIPTGATILSVVCTFRARIETAISARIPIHTAQMYAGTSTPKGTARTVAASAANYTLTFDPSEWTPAELNNAKLKLYAQRGSENVTTAYGYRIYGAELLVEYH